VPRSGALTVPEEFTTKLVGWEQFERNLNELQESIAKKGVVESARVGARVLQRGVIERAKATFRERTGRLFRGILIAFKIYSHNLKGSTVWFRIGLRTRPGKDSPWYGRLQELSYHAIGRGKGRRARHRRALKAGGGLGRVVSHPFMGPGFESSWQSALSAMATKLRSFIESHKGA